MPLEYANGSFASLFPRTRYFEMNSSNTGARYAIWVTVPPTYTADDTRNFPVIYEPDGNIGFPQSAPIDAMLYIDPIHPILPFIKVSVGYTPAEAQHFSALRNRDLIPPGDPVGETMRNALSDMAAANYISEQTAQIGRDLKLDGGADRFQAFIEDELHPALFQRYRIDSDLVGLWGYSLGGLFTTYVALKRSALFKAIGAGSPAIMQDRSIIFDFYRVQRKAELDYSGWQFHLTVALSEVTEPTYYQVLVGAGTTTLMALMGQSPLPGLRLTSEIITFGSHATAFQPSWNSFLRACYSTRT